MYFCRFKVKGQFQGHMIFFPKKSASVISHFHVILTGQSISETILTI